MFQRRDDYRFPDEWKVVVPESGSGGFQIPAGFLWRDDSQLRVDSLWKDVSLWKGDFPSRCRGDGLWMVSYQRKGGSSLAWRVD